MIDRGKRNRGAFCWHFGSISRTLCIAAFSVSSLCSCDQAGSSARPSTESPGYQSPDSHSAANQDLGTETTQPAARSSFSSPNPALSVDSSKNFVPLRVNVVAVMPLESDASGGLFPATYTELTQALIHSVQRNTSLEVINVTRGPDADKAIKSVAGSATSLRDRATRVGSALQAQGVLYGVVTKYEESSGSRFGADKLAQAGFRLWLVDPSTNKLLWTASYQNDEQPLSDNILRLGEKVRSGVGFRSAMELATYGFDSASKELQSRRESGAIKPAQ